MNKILVESIQNYLDCAIPENSENITLQKVIIINRMILRFQMEIYNETMELYRKNVDIIGILAQKLEVMGNQLNYLEKSIRQRDINAGRFPS